jgi:hypothetical protein
MVEEFPAACEEAGQEERYPLLDRGNSAVKDASVIENPADAQTSILRTR